MIQLAGRLATQLKNTPQVQRFLAGGGKELISSSIPGAVMTGGLTTLTTGNPLAGLAVGATDLAASSAIARGLGSQALAKGLEKVGLGKLAPKLAGRYETVTTKGVQQQRYAPSTAQQIGMGVGSVGAAVAVEPMFLRGVMPPNFEQLMNEAAAVESQALTSDQQLLQRELINRMQSSQELSPGTLYQLQGLPQASIDPYGLSRGGL
jgi:hypothetical protein